jgi:hypothetical protein
MSAEGTNPLPFVKATKGPRGAARTNFWAVKASGDYERDCRTGREYALQFMAYQNERLRLDPDGAPSAGSIVDDIIASGDRTGIAAGFFQVIIECSRFNWTPSEIARFRRHYEEADREYDEAMSALRRRKRSPVPATASPAH